MNTLLLDSPEIGYGLIVMVLFFIYSGRTASPVFIIIIIILALMLYFYREPEGIEACTSRDVPSNILLAPSYGTVKAIRKDSDYIYVAIFLSPADVHQQYYPVNGKVIDRVYDCTGKFEIAFDLDKSRLNEKKIHVIQTTHGVVLVTQIAGLLVRAIVSDDDVNVNVKAGQRFGMIKFGSRVDIAIPVCNGFELKCKIGDKLTGGRQTIGRWSY